MRLVRTINIPTGMITDPRLYVTDDGTQMMVVPEEKWFEVEVLDRIVSSDTKEVHRIDLLGGNFSTIGGLRRIEISLLCGEISNNGISASMGATLVPLDNYRRQINEH